MRHYYGSTYSSNARTSNNWSRRRHRYSSSYYDNEFYYGTSGYPWHINRSRSRREQSPPKPEPPKEELAKALTVESVDFMIEENAVKHKTDRYEQTQKDPREREVDGKKVQLGPECIVRRGDSMTMKITLNRPYKKKIDDLCIKLRIGDKANPGKETEKIVPLTENAKEKHGIDWGANLLSEGKTITVELFIPPDCIVGKWRVYIRTKTEKRDKKLYYDPKAGITILFNPWCTNDLTHCELDLDEYVLNETGFVYKSSGKGPKGCPWVFGQFTDKILDCTLLLLDKGFESDFKGSFNPVKVTRMLAAMVNSSDKKGGVLVGNWSGNYEGGVRPTSWMGSINILRQYFDTEVPVKYGQCWVFSGLLTTVCRALGIPCRSVTNFRSAHDTDLTNSIDTYYDQHGEEVKFDTNDSCWNFHVWNEAYFERPDLAKGFDGWQAIDATPQELSDGIFTCGPAPVRAVQLGRVDVGHDTGFVFSEVNADRVDWHGNPEQGWVQGNVRTNAVGKNISAKKPGTVEIEGANRWKLKVTQLGEKMRDDLTDQYKFPEGSNEERKAVQLACRMAQNPIVQKFNDKVKVVPVTIDIHVDDVMIGDDLVIDLEIKNQDNYKSHKIDSGTLKLLPETYTGHTGDPFKTITFEKEMPLTLDAGQSKKFEKIVVKANEYFDHLLEENFVKILAKMEMDSGTSTQKRITADVDFEFDKPDLDVKITDQKITTVKKGEEVTFTVEFKNPLSVPLTGCVLHVLSDRFLDKADCEVKEDVVANGHFKHEISVKASRTGRADVDFEFNSKELWDLKGRVGIEVN